MSDFSTRTDITSSIRGEIKDNSIILSLDGKPIGYVPIDASCVRMDQGYEVDDQRVYRMDHADLPQPDQYVECDEKGWC